MSSPTEISATQLCRRVGLPDTPVLVDLRPDEEFDLDSRLLPAARREAFDDLPQWAARYRGAPLVVYCQHGLERSQGAAAWLRHLGIHAQSLAGGFEAWREDGRILLRHARLPAFTAAGHTLWVTKARPKIDRIACPWLIRRFVDREAAFLFVSPSEVDAVAERFHATAFDVDGAFWSHRDERCTFDVMLEEFGLADIALSRLATIVRGADTDRLDLAPQSAGLLAISLGYSRMHRDDLQQLEAAMNCYDALYRWCRDASTETHQWPGPRSNR